MGPGSLNVYYRGKIYQYRMYTTSIFLIPLGEALPLETSFCLAAEKAYASMAQRFASRMFSL